MKKYSPILPDSFTITKWHIFHVTYPSFNRLLGIVIANYNEDLYFTRRRQSDNLVNCSTPSWAYVTTAAGGHLSQLLHSSWLLRDGNHPGQNAKLFKFWTAHHAPLHFDFAYAASSGPRDRNDGIRKLVITLSSTFNDRNKMSKLVNRRQSSDFEYHCTGLNERTDTVRVGCLSETFSEHMRDKWDWCIYDDITIAVQKPRHDVMMKGIRKARLADQVKTQQAREGKKKEKHWG
jgi:hypothetical protein